MVCSLTETPARTRHAIFLEMQAEAESTLAEQGFETNLIAHQRAVDCRYQGQEHTVRVPADMTDSTDSEEAFAARFHELHEQLYTFRLEPSNIEMVNFRLTSTVATRSAPHSLALPDDDPKHPVKREVTFASGNRCMVSVHRRSVLPGGFEGLGPAIIEENSSTTVVLPGQHFATDRFGNILISSVESIRKERSEIG